MPDTRQLIRVRVGSATAGALTITPQFAGLLRAHGYDPAAYNRVRVPIGMGNWTSGTLLLSEGQLETLRAAGAPATTASLEIGDATSFVTLAGIRLGAPQPVFVSGRGGGPGIASSETGRIYAVEVWDERKELAKRQATENYNLLTADRAWLNPDTAISATARTATDTILAALASALGISLTITDASAAPAPADIRIEGTPIVHAMDWLAAQSGRVITRSLVGAYAVELIDRRDVFDVLDPLSDSLVHGGVRYAVGSPPAGFVRDGAPVAAWQAQEVPEAVVVVSPTTGNGPRHWNDPAVHRHTAAYQASDAGLTADSGSVEEIPDSDPVRDPDNPTAAEEARKEAIAAAYYRRWVAGAMRAELTGAQSPTPGGSCQVIEYLSVGGSVRTRVFADFDWPGYGFHQVPDRVRAGFGIEVTRRPGGDEEVRNIAPGLVVPGVITERETAVDAVPGSHRYKAETWDGRIVITDFQTPLIRQFNDAPLITPAAVASRCYIEVLEDSEGAQDARIVIVDEGPAFEPCDGSAFTYPDGGDTNTGEFLVGRSNGVAIGRSGNVLVSRAGVRAGNPENAIGVGRSRDILFDRSGNALMGRSSAVQDGHYDDILAGRRFDTLVGRQFEVAVASPGGIDTPSLG